MNNKQDAEWVDLISRGLDSQSEKLDPLIAARLRRARMQAVAASQQIAEPWTVGGWLGGVFSARRAVLGGGVMAGAMALVLTLLLTLLLTQGIFIPTQETGSMPDGLVGESMLNEMDILMFNDDADVEFLENLEVYEWLAAEYG